MTHNIFLPKGWDKWDRRDMIEYHYALKLFDSSALTFELSVQYMQACQFLSMTIRDRVTPLVSNFYKWHLIPRYTDAELRAVGGIIIVYNPDMEWERVQSKLQLWMLDNWNITDTDSIKWIQDNLDSHIQKVNPVGDERYPKYIDLREITD